MCVLRFVVVRMNVRVSECVFACACLCVRARARSPCFVAARSLPRDVLAAQVGDVERSEALLALMSKDVPSLIDINVVNSIVTVNVRAGQVRAFVWGMCA